MKPASRRPPGPSQRQLRAGELIRHALVEVLRTEDINDEALSGVSVTLTEVRMGKDLRHARCFVEPLGGDDAPTVVKSLNRHSKFLRGLLGRSIDMKFTPELTFVHDESFNEATRMEALFADPKVARDLGKATAEDADQD